MNLASLLLSEQGIQKLISRLEEGRPQRLGQVGEGLRPLLIYALYQSLKRPLLLLFAEGEPMERTASLLGEWGLPVCPFPALKPHFGEKAPADSTVLATRLSTLWALRGDRLPVVCATLRSLLQPCPSASYFNQQRMSVRLGQEVRREDFLSFLNGVGYSRGARVEVLGEYSQRGAIVDVFTPSSPLPLRFEFEGDTLTSIRLFDPSTQVSEGQVEEALLLPWRAFSIHQEGLAAIQGNLSRQYKRLRERLRTSEARFLEETVGSDLRLLERGVHFLGEEYYHPFFSPVASLLSHLPSSTLILSEEEGKLQQAFEEARRASEMFYRSALDQGEVVPYSTITRGSVSWEIGAGQTVQFPLLPDWWSLQAGLHSFPSLSFSSFGGEVDFPCQTLPSYQGQFSDFLPIMKGWLKEGRRVILAGRGIARYQDLFRSQDLPVKEMDWAQDLEPGAAYLWKTAPAPGFTLPSMGLTLVSEVELFGWRRKPKSERRYREAKILSSWEELKPGDLVVHETYGIGRYQGLTTLEIDGLSRDYIQISYADQDKLYVPSEQIYLVAKYLGDNAKLPSLTRLRSTDWARTKRKARRAVAEIARQLLELYAAREVASPEPYPEVQPWEEDLSMTFAFEETADQERAIQDVMGDLQRQKPMDRLICGDVGYGKTEVALRAAFRTVLANKQVAFLAPTTILCQQHFNTFQERLRHFPVQTEMFSRFRSIGEQKEILQKLLEGRVDILIGTHSLLGKRVQFKDLGLLIVDEEQRFGVLQKERMRGWKGDLHVLTLSATPIPRTLQMSLLGIREVSMIETAPANRFPVKTYVVEADEGIVRSALLREIERGGQAFVVHNRIQGLPRLLARLQALLPEARIATAHGQMAEDRLEKTMWDFAQGRFDILLCTAIIESGIDLPNVNTLIVSDAQNLGLAQLYQLRGRVGRSDIHAYAYFLYPKHRALSEESEKRLEAIRDFTTLGAGLRIATRDLEIRGAGNLLGEEQHGFMINVGYQMYRQMLEEAMERLRKGEAIPVETDEEEIPLALHSVLEMEVSAYIPSDYIPDEGSKMELYERLASLTGEEDLSEVDDQLRDRFGTIPLPLENLLRVSRVRLMAEQAGIERVRLDDHLLVFQIGLEPFFDPERLVLLARRFPKRFKIREADFYLRLEEDELENALDHAEELLRVLTGQTPNPLKAGAAVSTQEVG
ncbi:MAG: transcription-repair coupling factor [Coprothermobacterota bacterium]|nr:transcription-repair coupling factor [Coprothermobacterota bacterium]